MNKLMSLEIPFLIKSSTTYIAVEREVTCVYTCVYF